jgi:sirohydrochlorin cobaltochelatase
MKRIERQVDRLHSQYPRVSIEHSGHFGFEDEIFALLDERVAGAGTEQGLLACDGCPYRSSRLDATSRKSDREKNDLTRSHGVTESRSHGTHGE